MYETVAVEGNNAIALRTNRDGISVEEKKLDKEVSAVEQKAADVRVTDDEGYSEAAELVKTVKQMQKRVKEYWEPLRVSTKKAYDDVLGHKKEMLDPLEKAEKIIKGKMTDYSMEQERKRKEQEAVMKRLAQQEVERKLAESIEAEDAGDYAAAEFAMAEAEVMDNVALSGSVQAHIPKADGVSQSKNWKITEIDDSQVPVNFCGMELRPIDEKAVLALIKASKGTIQIPGVKYEKSITISVRS